MRTEVIEGLEARLRATLRKIEDLDAENGKLEVNGYETTLSRQLRLAYCGLLLAIKGSIAFEVEQAIRRESAQLEKKFYEAATDFSLSEFELRDSSGGSFAQRWDRREVARERWESDLRILCKYRSTQPKLTKSHST